MESEFEAICIFSIFQAFGELFVEIGCTSGFGELLILVVLISELFVESFAASICNELFYWFCYQDENITVRQKF